MPWGFGVNEVLGPCPTPCRGLTSRSMSGSLPGSPRKHYEAQCGALNAHGLLLFYGSPDEQLLGLPIRQGELLHLDMTNSDWRVLNVSLHVNGFRASVVGEDRGEWRSVTWSPFAMVLEDEESLYLEQRCPVFRVGLTKDLCYVFATTGPDADLVREQWTADISRALRLLTKSIFPTFSIVVDPLEGIEATSTRLLAGYLLRSERDNIVSVLYCELHVQQKDSAVLAMYEDERCERRVGSISISQRTSIIDRRAVDCSCFSVDMYSFSARSLQEKQMWLSALSNIKVKLMNCAPEPSEEELGAFREAIFERISNLRRCEPPNPAEELPMLRPCRGVPVQAWCGTTCCQPAGGHCGEGPLFDPECSHQAAIPQALATHWSLPRDLPPVMAEAAMRKLAQGVPVVVSNCPAARSPPEAVLSPKRPPAAHDHVHEPSGPRPGDSAGGADAGAAPDKQVVYRNAACALLGSRPQQARSNFAMTLTAPRACAAIAPRPPRTRSAVFEDEPEWSQCCDADVAAGKAEVRKPDPLASLVAVPKVPSEVSTRSSRSGGKGLELFWSMEDDI